MKKTMLWGALCTLICTQVHAEATQQAVQAQTPGATNSAVTTNQTPAANQNTPTNQTNQTNQSNQPAQQVQTTNQQPAQNAQQNQTSQPQATQPVQTTTQQPTQNVEPQTTQQVPVEQQPVSQPINCDYKISADTKTIDQALVLTWSEKAATQAFDFEPASLDAQLQKLQACFTDQGWQGFNSALQKSGNIEAIKLQNLTVSSQLDGQAQVTEATANEWKITLPLQVVYQNNKEKVTQLLIVNLTIGRKMSGDLGITQMIATPRTSVTMPQSNDANTTTNPTSTSTTPNNVDTGTPPANTGTEVNPTNTNTTPTNTNSGTTTPGNTTTPTTPANSGTPSSSINNGSNQQNPGSGTTTTPSTTN
ncbi:DotI/IcmL family type IV secretion protein [Legionella quateirensis]|uniref:IcmL-like protein n=1 Tax=Legionella quateirensis TaxID=45072 RepID=A0A378L3I2_9GAMM|nr:DotI/IcmL family type IV secretion protein [Legionella quateirensis]KTD47545.1 IcmL-like protein [Legionella quateirensis]STY18700.1 IcmL-like protein [Legionella quateirensis]